MGDAAEMKGYDQWKTASPHDDPEYCELCGKMDMCCKCPACPTCDIIGRVECIDEHGLEPTHIVWYCIERLTGSQPLNEYAHNWYKHALTSVGFLLPFRQPEDQPDWAWDRDIPDGKTARDERPMGIAISGYVEGSDVEIAPNEIVKPFTHEQFSDVCEDLRREVEFYWKRDNTINLQIVGPRPLFSKPTLLFAQWTEWDDHPVFNDEANFPKDLKDHLSNRDWLEFDAGSWTDLVCGYKAMEWIDDSTY